MFFGDPLNCRLGPFVESVSVRRALPSSMHGRWLTKVAPSCSAAKVLRCAKSQAAPKAAMAQVMMSWVILMASLLVPLLLQAYPMLLPLLFRPLSPLVLE